MKKIKPFMTSSLIPYSMLILSALINMSEVIIMNKNRDTRISIQTCAYGKHWLWRIMKNRMPTYVMMFRKSYSYFGRPVTSVKNM